MRKFAFKFSNLLGTVYNNGNLLFTPDGNTLISPVGNRINLYDLRNNKSETLPIEGRYNFTTLALSPDGKLLIAVDEPGKALICSLSHRAIIHRYDFRRPVDDIKFSPDGRYIAATKENNLFIYRTPQCDERQYNNFALKNVFKFSFDKTLCIDWTTDSAVIAVGGADMTTKIYGLKKFKNLSVYTLGSHTDAVVGCFFEENSLNIYTVSKNGVVCVWDCSVDLKELVPDVEENEEMQVEEKKDETEKVFYKRVGRHFIRDAAISKEKGYNALSAAAFHRKLRILVTGFTNGAFFLYEMPECNQIHSLSLSNQVISSVAFNSTGDWIALGCSGIGQLVVWEWQSESFVMKQQGHFNNMQCLSYSQDGMFIATGGEDGKVKIWDTSSGFCIVTFSEHKSSITGVAFSQNGKIVLSASVDGTVRAFDLHRYRNFRTFTTPKPTQFSSLAVDKVGDLVCAGSEESFEIYVWAVRTGHLLSVLAGHEAPVSSVCFSPVDLVLTSTSWDKTLRFWNMYESKSTRETITLNSDGLYVTYRPDGKEVAVCTLDGDISFYNPFTKEQLGSIEGRNDLYVGRRDTDLITAKSILKSQAFTSLCYTADGKCILAAGRSKRVCIYNVQKQLLLEKFEITCNLSFGAVQDFINRRKMTNFGNKALIEERIDETAIMVPVPGSKKIDKSSRTFKPEINVSSIQFSPTGREWAATTTEGLLVFSLDDLVFDPFNWDINVTPRNIRKALSKEDYLQAIMMALKLNEVEVTTEVIETIKPDHVEVLASYLPELYALKLLNFIVYKLENNTVHIEYYSTWIQHVVTSQGMKYKSHAGANMTTWNSLLKSLTHKIEQLSKVCENMWYLIQYMLLLGEITKQKKESKTMVDPSTDDETMMDPSTDDESMMDPSTDDETMILDN